MPINVVCPGCKKRFAVSDQFAGQEGPCPQCKTKIKIPEKGEDVTVHAPEDFGPKTTSGQAVLKPIERTETKVTPLGLIIVIGSIAAVFIVALVMGRSEMTSAPILGFGALLLGAPLSVAGYTFLRNQELDAFRGGELWLRAASCGLVFAILWAIFYYLPPFAFDIKPAEMETFGLCVFVPILIAIGASAAMLSLDLDFTSGAIHYCLYVLVCILLRLCMGLPIY